MKKNTGIIGKLRSIAIGLVLSLLSLLINVPQAAAAVELTLSVSPSALSAPVGADFTLNIAVNPQAVTDLNSYQFDVSYNPAIITVIGTEGSSAGVSNGLIGTTVIPASAATAVPPATASWAFVPPAAQGKLRVTGNLHAPAFGGATGTGYLAQVHFHTVGTYNQNTNITISNAVFGNSLGGPIPATGTIAYNPGTVTIPYPAINVSINAPTQVGTGTDFIATVNTSLVANLNGFQFDLTYNQSIVQVIGLQNDIIGVTAGLIDARVMPIDMWVTFPGGNPNSPPSGGTIRVLGHIPNNIAVTGSGYLAQVHFHVHGLTGQTSLTPTNVKLFDDLGINIATYLPVTATGATVSILDILQITTNTPLPTGEVGVPYTQTLTAVGGTIPYTWAIQSGALPAGLSLNTSTGTISGTPTVRGNFNIVVVVNTSNNPSLQASKTINIRILKRGDANGDDLINMGDVVKLERIILRKDPTTSMADANRDGAINMSDVVKIERIILTIDN